MPKDGLLIVINDPDDCALILSVEMVPDPEEVTRIEENLIAASADYPEAEVTWEFEEKPDK